MADEEGTEVVKELEVAGDLKKEILDGIRQKGPDYVDGGLSRLDEKTYPEISQFKVEIFPNEGKHRGKPHCRVTTDKGYVSVSIPDGEIIAGKGARWSGAIKKVISTHGQALLALWYKMRPDDQALPAADKRPDTDGKA